jgi:hypothetical protein
MAFEFVAADNFAMMIMMMMMVMIYDDNYVGYHHMQHKL